MEWGGAKRSKVRELALIALAVGPWAVACVRSGGGGDVGLLPSGGIGTEWKWSKGVEARVAGPYALCGAVGTGFVAASATRPTAPEVAVAGRSGLVSFFSLDSGEAARPAIDVGAFASSVAYSGDGRRLVTAGDAGVQVVELSDGRSVFSAQPFAFATLSAALSPDGSLVAAFGQDKAPTAKSQVNILRLLSVADGTVVAEQPNIRTDVFLAPQFSRDGATLLVGAFVVSVPELLPLVVPLEAQAWTCALSPDGTMVAQGGKVWGIASGRVAKAPGDPQFPPLWAAFSPDGATYAESHEEQTGTTIEIFRTSDFSSVEKAVVAFPPESGAVPDGRFLFSGDGEHLVVTFDSTRAGGSDLLVLQELALPDLSRERAIIGPRLFSAGPAAFSPDGSLLAARLATSTGVWRVSDLTPLARIDEFSDHYDFLGNGLLAPGLGWLYDPNDGRKVGHEPIPWLAVSPDGTMAVSFQLSQLSRIEIVRLADLAITAVLDQALPEAESWIFSPDNRFVATAVRDGLAGRLIVFDAATGKTLTKVDGQPPLALSISGASARLIGGVSGVQGARVWSIPDGAALFDLEGGSVVAASPEGSLIATGGGLGILRIFSADTGALRQTIVAHGHGDPPSGESFWVSSVAFGQTGQIATVGVDETMRLWCSP